MEASLLSDGLCCWRRRRPIRGAVDEVCLPQPDAFGLVVLHPVLGFASSTSVDFGLKTAELFFFFTGVDVVDGLSSTSCVSI